MAVSISSLISIPRCEHDYITIIYFNHNSVHLNLSYLSAKPGHVSIAAEISDREVHAKLVTL